MLDICISLVIPGTSVIVLALLGRDKEKTFMAGCEEDICVNYEIVV